MPATAATPVAFKEETLGELARPPAGGGHPPRGQGHAAAQPPGHPAAAQAEGLRGCRASASRRSSLSRCREGRGADDRCQRAFFWGTGRRKTAVARVRLLPGEGEIVVNGRSLEEHFGNAVSRADITLPFRVTGTEGRFNAMVKVEGGGYRPGRRDPPRHRPRPAQIDPEANRLPLRQAGLLTRDPRMKERKKYGLKRARKAPQYTKR